MDTRKLKGGYLYGERRLMQSTFKEVMETLWLPFCLSMMGFVVRMVRTGVASWRAFISSLFCSAFAGIIAHWFLAGSGINTQIASAVIAMSGYCGGALIDAVSGRILREVSSMKENTDTEQEYNEANNTPHRDN